MSQSPRISFVPDRPAHDRRYALDCRKIARELGWRPRTRFDDGLAKTVRWYLDHSEWIAEVTEGRYDFGRLGLTNGRMISGQNDSRGEREVMRDKSHAKNLL